MRWLKVIVPGLMVSLAAWTIYRDRQEKARLLESQKTEESEMQLKLQEFEDLYLAETDSFKRREVAIKWGQYLAKYSGYKEVPQVVANGSRRWKAVVKSQ